MKRKIVSLVGILVFALFLWPQNTFAAEQPDQQCSATPDEQVPAGGAEIYQTFVPSLDRLTKVSLYISDENRTVNVAIQNSGGQTIGSSSAAVSTVSWYTPVFSSALEVTPGATYRLAITNPAIMTTWGNAHTGCYGSGQAYLNGFTYGGDWLFKTFGYNSSSGDQGTSDQGTGSTGSTAPSTNTSSSIAKPTTPVGEYLADQKAIKITWGKSTTTDIDGYRIFRSEEKTKAFAKVGEVNKSTLEYLDKTVTEGKTYYYYIRAYKGTTESYSSDTISVVASTAETAASDNSVTETAKNQPLTFSDTLKLYWLPISLIGFGTLTIAGFLLYKFWLKRKSPL